VRTLRSAWFDDLTLTHEGDGTSSLSGAVSDQAQLRGLLFKIGDFGVTLLSVKPIQPGQGGTFRVGVRPALAEDADDATATGRHARAA
jgi:hypothetical protein